jgi:Fe-Mn family superoxide dismutase
MAFELKPLPYAEDALEPHMSARTVSIHYNKHHRGYVAKLNELVANTPLEKKTLEELIHDMAGQRGQRPKKIFNNAAQVWNHTFFWESMKPKAEGRPNEQIAAMIDRSFGSYDEFKSLFKKTAVEQFGSGYVWLTQEGGRLEVSNAPNAMSPMAEGRNVLLGCDVWEHAYYLDFQNRRDGFVETFLDRLVDWNAVANRMGEESVQIATGVAPRAMRA